VKKRIFIFFIFIFSAFVINAQSSANKEFVILRVNYFSKQTGLEARLSIDIGTSQTHSLKGKFEEGKNGTLRYNEPGDKIIVFNNEIDILELLYKQGFEIIYCYDGVITGKNYMHYLLSKPVKE